MLNIFPIQFLAPLAYTLLRVILGFIFIRFGIIHITERDNLKHILTFPQHRFGLFFTWFLIFTELLIGTLFLLGFLTQIAALLSIILSLKMIFLHKRFTHPCIPSTLTYTLVLFISLSLFITGAGYLAFDIPL